MLSRMVAQGTVTAPADDGLSELMEDLVPEVDNVTDLLLAERAVKLEKESLALREWPMALPAGSEMVTSQLASLEISRILLRAGVDHQRVPYVVGQAVRGLFLVDVTSTVLTRARSYGIRRLGSLDATIWRRGPVPRRCDGFHHLRRRVGRSREELGFPVAAPS